MLREDPRSCEKRESDGKYENCDEHVQDVSMDVMMM